jgi:hypothetical protein
VVQSLVVHVVPVLAPFVANPEVNKKYCCKACREAGDVDQECAPVLHEATECDQQVVFQHIGDVITKWNFKSTDECRPEMFDHTQPEIPSCPSRRRFILGFEDLREITLDLFDVFFATKPTKEF